MEKSLRHDAVHRLEAVHYTVERSCLANCPRAGVRRFFGKTLEEIARTSEDVLNPREIGLRLGAFVMFPLLLAQAAAPVAKSPLWDVLARFEFWHWMVLAVGLYYGFVALMEGLKSLAQAGHDARLKRDMIARGMSAAEIVQVITAKGEAMDLPCASEVVVEHDGDWHAALVLQAANDQYYIHYIGNEMDSNEWVGPDRIRFPAGSQVPQMLAEWQAAHASSNGVPRKGPIMDEV
jgi:hypothetical protein